MYHKLHSAGFHWPCSSALMLGPLQPSCEQAQASHLEDETFWSRAPVVPALPFEAPDI